MNKNYLLGIGMLLAVLAVSVTPALAHVDVYFDPDPSGIPPLAPGESITIQLLADVDANENGIRSFQIGIDFDDDVVNFTNVENPCVFSSGGVCYVHRWTPFCELNLFPWNDSHFQWTTGSSDPGYDSMIAPIANITIEAIAPGTSQLNFTHTIRYEPSICLSQINDKTPATIPEENITWVNSSITVEGPQGTFSKSLEQGWNLISLPLTPLDSSVSAVLSGVSQDAVQQYDATTKTFADATTMAPGTGYFVHVTTAGDWVYEGTSVSSTSPGLTAGLNMIGVPSCTMSVSGAMGSADYRYVAGWNADDQKYEVYNPSAPAAFYGFTEMTAGEGYFVSAKSDDGAFVVSCP